MRALKFVKFASIYKETVEDIKENVQEDVKVKEEEEEDFYVITDLE
jgi:hypothetical protein